MPAKAGIEKHRQHAADVKCGLRLRISAETPRTMRVRTRTKGRGDNESHSDSLAALCRAIIRGAGIRRHDYPDKPIHVFTTSGAGGLSDVFMRALGDDCKSVSASR